MNKEEYHQDTIDVQAVRLMTLKTVYEEFVGEPFEYQVDCTRDVEMCNARRFADGGKNHTHALVIELPKRFEIITKTQSYSCYLTIPLTQPLAHSLTHFLAHPTIHRLTHPLTHSLTRPITHPLS